MDILLVQAAELCKQGALSKDTPLVAFEYFRNAMGLLLTKADAEIIPPTSPTLFRAINSLLHHPRLYHCMLWNANVSSPHDSPCIFSRAFVFRPHEDSNCPLALRIRVYIAMLFFNLAQTIHTCRDSLRYPEYALRVALEMYDVGFDLLLEDEACSNDDWATNISLALLNNSAEIHWALSNFAKARRVMDLQKNLLEIIQSNMRATSYSEKEIEIFIMNTHLLQAPSGAAAA